MTSARPVLLRIAVLARMWPLLLCADCLAQTIEQVPRPGDTRPELPEFAEPGQPEQLSLPPAPEPMTPEPVLSRSPTIYVSRIMITGNSVFSNTELAHFTATYENREISIEELHDLRLALTRHYIDHGYVNSGAVIPDQEIRDGTVEIRIVEGTLSAVVIEGLRHFNPGYIQERLELGAGVPLNIPALQEQIQILLQDSRINTINAELKPGAKPGEAVLTARVKESPPYRFNATFDNHIAPSIGGREFTFDGAHRNLAGFGDEWSGWLELAEGFWRFAGRLSVPVTAQDLIFETWVDRSHSLTVERPFNIIDIEGEYLAYGTGIRHPILRTPRRSLWVDARIERRESRTFLLGIPYSFAPGVQDGVSKVTVIRLAQDWTSRTTARVIAARSTFNFGVNAFTPTISETEPDGEFFTWLGQFQYAQRFQHGQFIFRTDVSVSADPLLPLEKFAIGGMDSVRGYRENQLVRDQGFNSSIEYRLPLFTGDSWTSRIQVAPFIDVGGAWEVDAKTPSPKIIAAAGIGLRWESDHYFAHLYWGESLVNADDPGGDVQDAGISFIVYANFFD